MRTLATLACLLACILPGLARATPVPEVPPPPPGATSHAAADALNGFGLRVLQELAAAQPRANVLVSPVSLGSAFAVLAEGAAGSTRTELLDGLGLAAARLPPGAVGVLGRALARGEGESVMVNSNALWLAAGFPIEAAFVDQAKAVFDATVEEVDFTQAATLPRINGWYAKETRGKIPKLLEQLDPATRLIIGNALYFKGMWESPFDPKATRAAPFRTAAGAVEVATMHKRFERAGYFEGSGMQGLRLRFAGGDFEMLFLLPAAEDGAAALLTPQATASWQDGTWGMREVEVALPRFDLGAGGSMNRALAAVGLGGIFSGNANFSGISSEALVVSEVVHKVALTVDEAGAEAAAATAIVMKTTAMRPVEEPARFIADRPFAVLIRHVPSRAILVAGVINDPRG